MPTALRSFTGRKAEVAVEGATAGEALGALTRAYPDLAQHIYQGEELRSFINVFVNEKNIKHLGGLAAALKDGDTVMLVPAIEGGNDET